MNKKGFTLIEMMIGLLISAVSMAAVYKVFINQARTYVIQDMGSELQQTINFSFDCLVNDLMMAGYDSTDPGSHVTVSTPLVPGDYSITVSYEQSFTTLYTAAYSLQNGSLQRQVTLVTNGVSNAQAAQVMLDNVSNLTFLYEIADGSWVNAGGVGTNKVLAVKVTLSTQGQTTEGQTCKRALSSTVIFRNLIAKG